MNGPPVLNGGFRDRFLGAAWAEKPGFCRGLGGIESFLRSSIAGVVGVVRMLPVLPVQLVQAVGEGGWPSVLRSLSLLAGDAPPQMAGQHVASGWLETAGLPPLPIPFQGGQGLDQFSVSQVPLGILERL